MTDHLLSHSDAGVLTLTLNRPEKKNALTGAMYAALEQALAGAEADPAVRVVLVIGAGGAFTSGNDLADFATWGASGSIEELPVIRAIRRIVAFPKPLVAAVRGPAVGFGTTLLAHCDAVLASETATFAMPFSRLGLVPEFGASLLMPLLGGRVRASHHLLLGDAFGRDEAVALGLVSACCEDAALEAKARALAGQFAALPPGTLRTIKGLINHPADRERLNAAIEAEIRQFLAGLASPEHREAVAAFAEKRAPDFSKFA